jgi:two-component system cell cycle sensor histidine kinase/response regulator CckA
MTRILIVDDKEENIYYLQALLTGHGFEVEVARHGAEALVKARMSPPDVIISDLLMPVMDGYTLLRLWKADARLKAVPFIVYTATYTDPEDERLALSLGADAFVLKPMEPEDFLARLRQVQGKKTVAQPAATPDPNEDEKELLKVYSERLIRKLEEKTLQLEESNQALQRDIAERKHIEETLRLLNSAVMQAKESIVITDAELDLPGPRIIFVNPAFTQMTGYSAQEVIGRTPRILQGPRTDEAVLQQLREKLERGDVFEGEAVQYRKDGTTYFQEWQIAPLHDAGGKITHFVSIQRDITQRKQTEQALSDSEEKFSKIFESSPIAMSLSTLKEGRYLDANKQFLQLLECTREALIGRTSTDLKVWANRQERDEAIVRLKAQGSLRNMEMDIRGQAGKTTPILWSAEPIVIAGEHCLLGSSLDMTDIKRADEELRWKTAFLEAQVDSSMDGIIVVDNHGKTILQNRRMNELWKIPAEIAATQDDATQREFVTNKTKNPQQFTAKIAYLNSQPDAVSRDEIELVDGTILDRYSSPVRDKAGKYYGRIWVFRDMTEHRNLEGKLRQAQKMEAFGQLAGGVAHDFNNILAVIQLQAGLLKTEKNLSLQQLNIAGDIEKAAERAANLTRQLLLFSRQQTMQPHDLNLKDVVANMTRMLQRTIGVQVQLQFKFSEQPILIHADAGMIDQILLNLTVNARDAMPKGGQIIIKTSAVEFDEVTALQISQARAGSFACLSVSDAGCGISPEIRSRIFEPFFTTKDVGKGTGLGLATVFGIVHQHKGWINVYSEVGQGTTFRVYLPRLQQPQNPKTVKAPPAAIRGGDETILLVEDEPALLASIRAALLRLGYRVLDATNSSEALAVWEKHRAEIDLLLTDLVMPGEKTGKELAEQLLQADPELKVIYTSGYSAEIAGKDFLMDEGINFLTKPFEAAKLAQTLRNRLDKI